jgi:ATP adenylyltransferase
MSYIQDYKNNTDCVFCRALESPSGFDNLIVHRGSHAYVILNRFPYTSGHLMVVPFQHLANLDDFSPETRAEMMELTAHCVYILRENYNAEGFNLGANIGSAGGAGIPKHFHFHIVPRWGGDTNFMSTIGETRVVPEDLRETYIKVREAWKQLSGET